MNISLLCGAVLAFLSSAAYGGWNAGGGAGGGVKYSHATDCPNAGFVANPLEACVDQDDGKVWTCKAAPIAGAQTTQCDIAADWLLGSSASASGVTTWNARSGVVVPVAGDYTATQVTSTATGNIAATTTQAAIAELETEKQSSDPDLTEVAGLLCTTGQVMKQSAGGAWTCDTDLVGSVTTGLKTDISVVSADTSWVIVADAVTNDKAGNMGNFTLKGRFTTGSGDPEDLSPAQARQILNVADGANNYVHPNHTGEVTSVGDGGTTIAGNAVTNGKMSDVPSQTLKGRVAGGTGDPQDLIASDVLSILDSQVASQAEFNQHLATVTDAHDASAVSVAPAGGIAATNVQTALQELDTEKQTGNPNLTTIAGLTCISGQIVEQSGTGWVCGIDDTGGAGGVTTGGKNEIQVVVSDSDWQIVNDKVTNAKLNNMVVNTLKGRATAGTGDPEDLTTAQVTTMLDAGTPGIATQTELAAHTGQATGAHAGTAISNAPTGTIAATTTQGAINELDTEKQISDPDLTEVAGLTCATGQIMKQSAGGAWTCDTDLTGGGSGSGDVVGPASAIDNALPRFDTTTGKLLQGSGVTVDDSNNLSTPGTLTTGAGSSAAGVITFTEGTAPAAATTNTVQLQAPPDVVTPYDLRLPTQPASGVLKSTNAGGVVTTSFGALTSAELPADLCVASPGAAPTVENTCAWDSTAHRLKYGENGVSRTVAWTSDIVMPPVDMQTAFNNGKTIFNANSLANSLKIGVDDGDGNCNEANEGCWAFYVDAEGLKWVGIPNGHKYTDIPNTFAAIWRYDDGTTNREAMRLDSVTLKFLNQWRPKKSVEVIGYEFGTCAYSEAVIATGKPKVGVFTCTGVDTDGFFFDFMAPKNWDPAAGIIVQLKVHSVEGTPAGNVVLECSAQAVSDGDVIPNTTKTSEQFVTMPVSVQYQEETAESNIITVQNTPVAGDHIYGHCDIDDTLNTVASGAQQAGVKIHATAKVYYTTTQLTE